MERVAYEKVRPLGASNYRREGVHFGVPFFGVHFATFFKSVFYSYKFEFLVCVAKT